MIMQHPSPYLSMFPYTESQVQQWQCRQMEYVICLDTNKSIDESDSLICQVVCLTSCFAGVGNTIPSTSFSYPSIFAFSADLCIYSGTAESISYIITGSTPSRILTIDFFISKSGSLTNVNKFQVILYEAIPNVVRIDYYYTWDSGNAEAIGVQSQ